MTFKIQGLPLDIDQKELTEALVNLGFDSLKMENVRRMYENFNGHMFLNGLVMFRISCNNEKRQRLVSLTGEHKIQLADFDWKISIHCLGFCIRCKAEGHKIADCPNKPSVKCFHCKKDGHVKSKCTEYFDQTSQKTAIKRQIYRL